MTENKKINGWTFEETIKCAENLMEVETNMFKWDVLRHLRDFTENYKEENQQYHAIGTVKECQEVMEKQRAKKPIILMRNYIGCYKCPHCNNNIGTSVHIQRPKYCDDCGQKINWSEK